MTPTKSISSIVRRNRARQKGNMESHARLHVLCGFRRAAPECATSAVPPAIAADKMHDSVAYWFQLLLTVRSSSVCDGCGFDENALAGLKDWRFAPDRNDM